MTHKSILSNIIERESRTALEEAIQSEYRKFGHDQYKDAYLDFGTVEFTTKDRLFQSFAVYIHQIGTPYNYVVIGYVTDTGFVHPTHWRDRTDNEWKKLAE